MSMKISTYFVDMKNFEIATFFVMEKQIRTLKLQNDISPLQERIKALNFSILTTFIQTDNYVITFFE